MLLNFKQGIIQAQPGFIAAGGQFVSLVISGSPVSFTICSSTKNYTYVEQETVTSAWGPIFTGVDQWLYWDINTFTAQRTFGVTLFQPVVSGVAPVAPAIDQHWFDTSVQQMKVWSGSVWNPRLRVFACKLSNGAIPQSMSINAPDFTGTQAGITAPDAIFSTGEILFDAQTGQPLRVGTGYFATTVDRLTTTNLSSESIVISSAIVPAQLTSNVGASTVVEFTGYSTVSPATQFTAALGKVYGLVTVGSLMGTTVNVVTAGPITNDLWDFSMPGAGGLEPGIPPFARFPTACPVNTPLYSDSTGQLTSIPGQTPVAVVTGRRSILMGSPQIRSSGSTNVATASTYGVVQLNIPPNIPGSAIVVGDNDPRLDALGDISNKVNRTGDTMTGILTLVGNPVDPLDSVPKQYVDAVDIALDSAITTGLALKLDIAGGTLLGSLTLNADPVFPLEAATKQYVDGITTGFMPLTGGTMSGFLELNADPFSNLQAATKQYVDTAISGVSVSQPLNQIVYGTGSGIDSSSTFTYDPITGDMLLLPTAANFPGNITIESAGGTATATYSGSVYVGTANVLGSGAGPTANAGDVLIYGGRGRGVSGRSGSVNLQAGEASATIGSIAGDINIAAGDANLGGIPGSVNITAGSTILSVGDGGDVNISAGSADSLGNGGNINIIAGSQAGGGADGIINLIIPVNGSLQINGDAGNAGNVLISTGSSSPPSWQSRAALSTPAMLAISKPTVDNFFAFGLTHDVYEWNMNNSGLTVVSPYNGTPWLLSVGVGGLTIDASATNGTFNTQVELKLNGTTSSLPTGSFMTIVQQTVVGPEYINEYPFAAPLKTFSGGVNPVSSFDCTVPNLPGGSPTILWKVRLYVPYTGTLDPTLQSLVGNMTVMWIN